MADDNSRVGILIGIFVCILIFIVAIGFIVFGVTNKQNSGPACTQNNQCTPTQLCNNGFCAQKTCNVNSDCGTNQTCAYNFCFQNTCSTNNDCSGGGTTSVCINSLCTPLGTTCGDGSNCFNNELTCSNGKCVQCRSNSDCPNNGFCNNTGVCTTTCNTPGVTCTTGTVCLTSGICCGPNFNPLKACTTAANCVSQGLGNNSFCVNGSCACQPGPYGSKCGANSDCQSGNCTGGICLNSGDSCFANFSTSGVNPSLVCPQGTPFCSNGHCSTNASGAHCSCFIFPANNQNGACTNQYQACNLGGTGFSGSVTYCINNVCNLNPGWINDKCTTDSDCSLINGIQKCTNGRCVGNI